MEYEKFLQEKRKIVWNYDVGKNKDTKDKEAFKHPARFPERLKK